MIRSLTEIHDWNSNNLRFLVMYNMSLYIDRVSQKQADLTWILMQYNSYNVAR